MNNLTFIFNCLDGKYEFNCQFENSATFTVETDIPELESKQGELDEKLTEKFLEELKKAQIEKWERYYDASNPIEDAVKWHVKYSFDNKEYVSSGEESYEPYNYEHLISAIMLCDDKASYFMI